MNKDILVSVIMCVYNTQFKYLKEAVLSILNQTYQNFELIIVDDHSDNDLYNHEIFNDKRIVVLKNDQNHGPSYSRNRALDIAKGKYVAIMDSDDVSFSPRIQEQVAFLESNPKVVACGTWFKFIGSKKHEVTRIIDDNEYYRCCLLFDNVPTVLNPSAMIRKATLVDNGIRWEESLRIGEDYFMWVRLAELGVVTNLKKVLLFYRVHNEQTTSSKKRKRNRFNCNIVKEYQLEKLGIADNSKIIQLLNKKRVHSLKTLNRIKDALDRIVDTNKTTHYFNDEALKRRCDYQINKLINSISNPFLLLLLFFNKKYKTTAKQVFDRKIRIFFYKRKTAKRTEGK